MSDALVNLKKQLGELEAFMQTGAYSSRQATLKVDLADVEQGILARPPLTEEDRTNVLMLYGRRDSLLTELSFFEESCATLKDRILDAEDKETKAQQN